MSWDVVGFVRADGARRIFNISIFERIMIDMFLAPKAPGEKFDIWISEL